MLRKRPSAAQGGFSLIEVAVAAAVFSLGLGSMSLLLLLAAQGMLAPRAETLAALHARSLVESLRLVPDGDPVAAEGAPACSEPNPCPPEDMSASIMESWQRQIERDIPTGRGLVCRDSAPIGDACDGEEASAASITWRESDAETGGESTRRFTLALPVP